MSKASCLFCLIAILLSAGCTSVGKIENRPVAELPTAQQRYSLYHYSQQHPPGDTLLFLAFSGGGTRAAALAYGVLEELRDTRLGAGEKHPRLLDEVDRISSVSGGSFTSAYYGLFGEQIFEDFKEVFLYKDVQGELSSRVLDIFGALGRVFNKTSRTETAIDYYDQHIFRGKTFADMQRSGGPFILINATDLNARHQFIFIQPQFDFLCSDISEFKVARAVAASSAVPVLFPPILVKRHGDCQFQKPEWLKTAYKKAIQSGDVRLKASAEALEFYLNENNPPYVTLVDGGVTDNLGLRTILNTIGLSGGAQSTYNRTFRTMDPPKRMVVIVVNASTSSKTNIGQTATLPSVGDTLSAVTDIQLHLYNTESNALLKRKLINWAETVSTQENKIAPYFIEISVDDIVDLERRRIFNDIPTSFRLEKDQVDELIQMSKILLRNNPEYRKLLQELGARPKPP